MAQTTRPGETEAERRARAAAEEEQTRQTAEARTEHLPRPGDMPGAVAAVTAAEALPNEPTVLMNFPTAVTLTLPGYQMVYFEQGVQPVPQSLAKDDYLVASGVTPVAAGRH
jgi:hypothetical protein